MARHHMTLNGPIPFTPEEEAISDAKAAEWAANAKDRFNSEIKRLREAAYKAESDSLFFKAQRGEATIDEWQNKIAEIKSKFPYQE